MFLMFVTSLSGDKYSNIFGIKKFIFKRERLTNAKPLPKSGYLDRIYLT